MKKNKLIVCGVCLSCIMLSSFIVRSSTLKNEVVYADESNYSSNYSLGNNNTNFLNEDILAVRDFGAMETEQLDVYKEIAKNSANENIIKRNREFSETEQNREFELRQQYYNYGISPNNRLSLEKVDNQPYFDINTMEFVFPEKEMNDEELLEIIDFNAIINYCLELEHESQNKELTEKISLNEDELKTEFVSLIEDFYDISVSEMNLYDDVADGVINYTLEPKNMSVIDAQGKPYYIYTGVVDTNTGKILSIDSYYSYRGKESEEVSSLTEDEKSELYSVSYELLSDVVGSYKVSDFTKTKIYVPVEKGKSINVVYNFRNEYYSIELAYPTFTPMGYIYCNSIDKLNEDLQSKVKFVIE